MMLGSLVGRILEGSWRRTPPGIKLTDDEERRLERVIPLLASSGTGALARPALTSISSIDEKTHADLQSMHRYFAITNAVHEQSLAAVFDRLREDSIEPLLVKGWAIGRMYADSSRRPFGDIDICVRPDEHAKATKIVESANLRGTIVDLHSGLSKFYEISDDDIWKRSRLISLNGSQIRVPSEEDHFRQICLHFLRHGGKRVLWACDIAVAVETRSASFDWQIAIGNNDRHRNWVTTAVSCAASLLNLDMTGVPFDVNPTTLPAWVREIVLREWSKAYFFPPQVAQLAGDLKKVVKEVPRHWPNVIEASMNFNAMFGERPQVGFQFRDFAKKGLRVLVETRGLVKPPSK